MWRKYRRAVAAIEALVILGLPFVRVDGRSALRFDLGSLELLFFGAVVPISSFYLVLLAVVFLALLLFVVTNVFGRLWCGWACPQTVLLDISTDLSRVFPPGGLRRYGRYVWLLPIAAVVALSLIWYFVPPVETFRRLSAGQPLVVGFFLSLWAVIYLELALLGRRFCATICPYSMLQSAMFDSDTLVVEFDRSRLSECMNCAKCARVCPVGIDIREGLRRECVACAECIDACSSMVSKKGIKPLIGYRGRMLKPKAFVLFGVAAVFALLFALAVVLRPSYEFVISREPQAPAEGVNRYSYLIRNNLSEPVTFALSVEGPYLLVGPGEIEVEGQSAHRGSLLLKLREEDAGARRGRPRNPVFILEGAEQTIEQEAGFL